MYFLVNEKQFPEGLISVEMGLRLNNLYKRCDIVIFDKTGKPRVIVECKAPKVKISQKTFDQIATYNLKLNVDYLIVTNGMNHYCCMMQYEKGTYVFLDDIPSYNEIGKQD